MSEALKAVPRKHHYVSQFYLLEFADANNQLFTVDAKERRSFTLLQRASQRSAIFNRIEAEGVPPDAFEKRAPNLKVWSHRV